MRRGGTDGFTLVEVLVALVLFALIGGAGFTMLDQVLRTQRQTEGRLERLAGMQRAMHLIRLDFTHARGASLELSDDETPAELGFRRSAAQAGEAPVAIIYSLADDVLIRAVSRGDGIPDARQPLLTGASAAEWQFYDRTDGWVDRWPPLARAVLPGQAVPNPLAVELTVTLAPGNEVLRRVVLLPAEVR